ncbi:hypothetical protein KQI67_30180 [Bacillus albus]|uniref:hypothetical protein n=1 Tax=Bacillus albus TaxID=2026189 RepID=UPI001C0F5803|nr:hypothetical protein [Bacillus albus]MBU5220813.1 hypothetical protein [Bacillus albus]
MLWDFYELEKLSRNKKRFKTHLEVFMKEHTVEETLDLVRLSGICFNPYHSKINDTYKEIVSLIEARYPNCKEHIDEFVTTINSLNSIFQDFRDLRETKALNKIPQSKRVLSFIVALEIWMGSLTEYIKGRSLQEIKKSYPFVISLYDPGKAEVLPVGDAINHAKGIADSVVENAGRILKYLQYENGTLEKLEHVSMNEIRAARDHIELFDIFSSLINLEQKWKFSNAIITEDNNNFNVKLNNDGFLRAQESSKIRFISQKNKWYYDFLSSELTAQVNTESVELAPKQYLCEDEVFYSIAIGEFLLTHDLNIKCLNVSLTEWIRAYTIIILESKKELENRFNNGYVRPISLGNWTIFREKKYWKKLFVKRGISRTSTDIIIEKFIFNNDSKDLLDCPFIEFNGALVLIPSIAASIDPSMSLVSLLVNNNIDISFKGTGLETDVLKALNTKGILAKRLKQSHKGETFECDAAFELNNELFFVEIKAFGQHSTYREYYNLLLKLYAHQPKAKETSDERSTTEQLERIADFYIKNMGIVCKELDLPENWKPKKIHKIILTTAMLGEPLFVNNTYIVDHSVFIRFLNRIPPGISFNNKLYVYRMPDFEGDITSEKLLNVLNNPPQIWLGNRRIKIEERKITLKNKTLDYPYLDDALGDFIKVDDETLKKIGIDGSQLNEELEGQ